MIVRTTYSTSFKTHGCYDEACKQPFSGRDSIHDILHALVNEDTQWARLAVARDHPIADFILNSDICARDINYFSCLPTLRLYD